MEFRRAIRAILGAVFVSLVPAIAHAGNDDGVLLGNEAAMTGGAVNAIVSDGSGTWYNPAGIALIDRDSLDLSGSATMLRIGVAPGLLHSDATGAERDGSYYELFGIPSAVTLVRRLDPKTAFGLGIFVPQQTGHTDRLTLAESVRVADGTMLDANYQLTQQESSQTYYGGVTFAFALLPNLRVGVTLFGTYRQFSLSSTFFIGGTDLGAPTAALGLSQQISTQSVSLELGAGLQWEMSPGFFFGAALRSPGMQLGSQVRLTSTSFSATDGDLMLDMSDDGGLRTQVDLVTPTRLRLGFAYRWARGWIGVDGDVQHELRSPASGVNREWIGGVRLGARYQIDETISIGAGLFTDLDPTRPIDTLGATSLDFFGGTFGIELRNPHRLGEGERAAELVFVNTFGLRYAVGVGSLGGLRLNVAAQPDPEIAVVPVWTTVHEISLHLGSALYF